MLQEELFCKKCFKFSMGIFRTERFLLALNFHFWPFFKISESCIFSFETSVVPVFRSFLLYLLSLDEKYCLFFPKVEIATK